MDPKTNEKLRFGHRADPCGDCCCPAQCWKADANEAASLPGCASCTVCGYCWGGGLRAALCGTFCIPCVYARAYEMLHPHLQQAKPVWPATASECPRSLLGCCACCVTMAASDGMVPMLAAYEATHANDEATTTDRETCTYITIGCLPCVYFQSCQIAAEIRQAGASASTLRPRLFL